MLGIGEAVSISLIPREKLGVPSIGCNLQGLIPKFSPKLSSAQVVLLPNPLCTKCWQARNAENTEGLIVWQIHKHENMMSIKIL